MTQAIFFNFKLNHSNEKKDLLIDFFTFKIE